MRPPEQFSRDTLAALSERERDRRLRELEALANRELQSHRTLPDFQCSTVPLMENNKSESKSHLSFPFNGHHCMNWGSLLLSLVLCIPRAFAGALAGDLIAHYRFDTNGSDSLGRSPPFVVTNGDQSRAGVTYAAAFAVTNAPFTNGVLYVNGRYEPNGHFVNYLGTAPIKDLRYESFAGGPGDTTEREFTFDNHSNGSVFFGYAAHLKILGRALAESEVASVYNESLSEHPKFPRRHFLWPAVILIL